MRNDFGEEVPNRKFVTPKIFNNLISMDILWIVEISPKFIPPKILSPKFMAPKLMVNNVCWRSLLASYTQIKKDWRSLCLRIYPDHRMIVVASDSVQPRNMTGQCRPKLTDFFCQGRTRTRSANVDHQFLAWPGHSKYLPDGAFDFRLMNSGFGSDSWITSFGWYGKLRSWWNKWYFVSFSSKRFLQTDWYRWNLS